ncbi:glycosyltransferase family 4 protein [Paraglaciecola sp. L3A3]|uniref:glycosyltransferase family 4 protein n=1 Tax=Paraglaciecola sp. L3A3 TaxID=2686358 RepID=UPI00131BF241|nr:glycosyltransferase family 4 protein [Paraglaciecola sp. L3A3]
MSSLLGKRILIISHGHPDIKKGGAEVASYNMYKELYARGEDVFYLAQSPKPPHGGTSFSGHNGAREILFHTKIEDGFLFSNFVSRSLWKEFRDMLKMLKPNVIHLHHYVTLGIEIIEEIKRTLPDAKIILTLHEYLAICHNKGLMVKTNGDLCYQSSPRNCADCFVEKSPADFFLREKYIKRLFENVHTFISPSYFLKARYVEWGIEESRICVIENGQPVSSNIEPSFKEDSKKVRFAFFGQLNPNKGIELLLQAVNLLPLSVKENMTLEIHGANLTLQSSVFQDKISQLLDELSDIVFNQGPYEQSELPLLLSKVDWVVVPSNWWENSPMVIQEAFQQKVPVIASNIGGMAEKVTHGKDGLHFQARSVVDLSQTIIFAIKNPLIRKRLVNSIETPLSIKGIVDKHIELYA